MTEFDQPPLCITKLGFQESLYVVTPRIQLTKSQLNPHLRNPTDVQTVVHLSPPHR